LPRNTQGKTYRKSGVACELKEFSTLCTKIKLINFADWITQHRHIADWPGAITQFVVKVKAVNDVCCAICWAVRPFGALVKVPSTTPSPAAVLSLSSSWKAFEYRCTTRR
jgi:hypothetical protein